MRSLVTVFALSTLFFVSVCSAQQGADNRNVKPEQNASPIQIDGPIIGGRGLPNYIPVWTTPVMLGNSAIYQAGGNVGIRTITPKATLDVAGGINASGAFTGSGAGLTGIQFSQLSGVLSSSQLSGNYSNAVTLSNASNVYYGNGSNLTGVSAGAAFVNTNYPIVNLPTQAGQQVALGATSIPAGAFNSLNLSFDIWAAITWGGGFFNGGFFQPRLYLCDTPTCSGQLNAELGYVEVSNPSYEPNGLAVRASYAVSAAGTTATAVGSESVQVDVNGSRSSSIYSYSNQQSQQFDSTQPLYFVVVVYIDSIGTQYGTPTGQMNVLRLIIAK